MDRTRGDREHGFTLIELLIVISIIALLAGFAMVGISVVRQRAAENVTTQLIASLTNALEQYVQDEGFYPGQLDEKEIDEETNDFPLLFDALFDDPKNKGGRGGRNSPYMQLKEDQVYVFDKDLDDYRPADRKEITDRDVKKFLIDAWGNRLVYRCNKGRPRSDFMVNRNGVDIYSIGQDATDQTQLGEKGDDIGNF